MGFMGEVLPIAIFYIAYKLGDLFIATAAALICSSVILVIQKIKTGNISSSQLFSFIVIFVCGVLTLALQDERFIKWKATIVYWAFAVMCAVTHMWNRNIMQMLMDSKISLPTFAWKNLNISWGIFFACMGGLNWVAMQYLSTASWVNYKFFGTLILTSLFVLVQSIYLGKHLLPANASTEEKNNIYG